MGCATPDTRDLRKVIYDMDEDVNDLLAWGALLRDLGTVQGDVDPRGLFVMSSAVMQAAERHKRDWQRAFDLTHPAQEGGR